MWFPSRLKRGPDGKFNDDDLASILYAAIESPAGAFGGLNTPESLRFIEILGIRQARGWGLGTFNEFREFLGLKSTFSCGNRSEFTDLPNDIQDTSHLKNGVTFRRSRYVSSPDVAVLAHLHVFFFHFHKRAARHLYGHIDNLEIYVRGY